MSSESYSYVFLSVYVVQLRLVKGMSQIITHHTLVGKDKLNHETVMLLNLNCLCVGLLFIYE